MTTRQVFTPLASVLTGMAGRILASSRRHGTQALMSRFSNHELADMGFERDWDGSIHRSSQDR